MLGWMSEESWMWKYQVGDMFWPERLGRDRDLDGVKLR